MICLNCGKTDFTRPTGCTKPVELTANPNDWVCRQIDRLQNTPEAGRQLQLGQESMFWIVWCPRGKNPPRYKHKDRKGAMAESRRLASQYPNEIFFVLEVIGGSMQESGSVFELHIDDIPF